MIIIIGHIGSDAGYSYIGSDGKIHHVPGWNPEAMLEFDAALATIRSASQLKAPGIADGVLKSVLPYVQAQVKTYFGAAGEGPVVVAAGA